MTLADLEEFDTRICDAQLSGRLSPAHIVAGALRR